MSRAARGVSFVCLLAGAVIVAGWIFRIPAVLKFGSDSAVVMFSTGLGAALVAAALLVASWRRVIPTILFAVPAAAICLAILWAWGTDSGVFLDTMLGDPFITDEHTLPGRMAVSTAAGLLSCASGALVMAALHRRRFAALVAASLGAISLGIGAVSLAGYMSSLGIGTGWGVYNGMSPQASFLLTLLGSATMMEAWSASPRTEVGTPVGFALPVLIGSLTFALMGFLSFSVYENHRSHEHAALRATEGAEAVNRRMDTAEDTILRVALLMAEQQEIEPHEWENAVATRHSDLPGLILYDIESHGVRSHSPVAGPVRGIADAAWQHFGPFNGKPEPVRFADFSHAGVTYLLVSTAVFGSRGHIVRLLAVFDTAQFVAAALPDHFAGDFSCRLTAGERELYADSTAAATAEWHERPLSSGSRWSIAFQPSEQYQVARKSGAPVTVLVAGIGMSILLTLSTHLALQSRAAAGRLAQLNIKLNESNERLEQLVAALPEAVLTVTPDGTIEEANQTSVQVFGRARESLIGVNVESLLGLDSGSESLRRTRRIHGMSGLIGKVIDVESTRENGQAFTAALRVAGLNTVDGRKYLVTVADITWRRTAEQENQRLVKALRQSNEELTKIADEARENAERFATLLASAPEATILVDEGGTILEFSRQAEILLGYKRDEAVGQPVELLVPADIRVDHVKLRSEYMKAPDDRRMARGRDLVAIAKTGQEIPVEVNLSPLSFKGQLLVAASLIDLRERLKAQDMIREKSAEAYDLAQRYQNLMHSDVVGMAHIALDGRITEINQAFGDMLGYDRESILGRKITDFNHAADSEEGGRLVRELITGVRDHYRITKRYVHSSGRDVWVDVAAVLIRDESGQPGYCVGLALDITPLVEAKLAVEASEKRLRLANKELESIVYVASHDMRSPLVNLQGFSRQLTEAVQKLESELAALPADRREAIAPVMREEIPEAIGYIASSTRKMDSLIKGLLRLSRLGRMKLELRELDMKRLVADTVRATQFILNERGITVEIGDLPRCMGDEAQMGQVFSNLLDNAIKYLDPSRPGQIRISGRLEGEKAVYVIEDNGIGIAEGHQAHVFEIFHRLDPAGTATGEGLGLSVVRRILDRHDGDIRLESEVGKGSRFIVSIPYNIKVTGR